MGRIAGTGGVTRDGTGTCTVFYKLVGGLYIKIIVLFSFIEYTKYHLIVVSSVCIQMIRFVE